MKSRRPAKHRRDDRDGCRRAVPEREEGGARGILRESRVRGGVLHRRYEESGCDDDEEVGGDDDDARVKRRRRGRRAHRAVMEVEVVQEAVVGAARGARADVRASFLARDGARGASGIRGWRRRGGEARGRPGGRRRRGGRLGGVRGGWRRRGGRLGGVRGDGDGGAGARGRPGGMATAGREARATAGREARGRPPRATGAQARAGSRVRGGRRPGWGWGSVRGV